MMGAAEAHVETGANNALRVLDIDECRAEPNHLWREANLARAKIIVVVFDESRQDAGEGIFRADPDGPSRSCHPRRIGSPQNDGRSPIVIALPGTATSNVAQEPVPGVANASGGRCQRVDLAVIGDADFAHAIMAALGIRPSIVTLNTDHEAACKLIVATGLQAAYPAIRIVPTERLAEKGATGCPDNPILLRSPHAARMTAPIAAGPVPCRYCRRRSLVGRSFHVGRARRTCQ